MWPEKLPGATRPDLVVKIVQMAPDLQSVAMLLSCIDGYGHMRAVIWFFQRYAAAWSLFAALVAKNVLLPANSPWWQDFLVAFVVWLPLYLFLYKNGVTSNRTKRNRDSSFR
ncbi:hypothetical protein [Sphingobium yanoikuyae]|uniref:hypothetical protein n=1 Tax=Sphingobium yanoikuyae TaxID=13690 RepID=UPI00244815F0|nr:hypothetical protein [Sphingobium yanoikuyae]MDH2148264.1 hypothetical protein [Sphingobium yanoikuyae]